MNLRAPTTGAIFARLGRFGGDERGTTLTELLLTLPIFITVFAGVVHIGQLHQQAILSEGAAYKKTFNKALSVQNSDLGSGLSGLLQGSTDAVHMSPASASADATVQLETYQPRQEGLLKGAVKVAEHTTYSFDGLALSGHLGESYSRVRPLNMVGVGFLGVDDAVTPNPEDLFGHSYLTRDLLYDGPNADFDGSSSGFSVDAPLQSMYSLINGAVTMTGARGALAANMRYGTVTGVQEDVVSLPSRSVDYRMHYSVSVPTYVSEDPWFDQMRAMVITRFTMANPNYGVYNKTFGFHGQPEIGAANEVIEVPTTDEIPLTTPLNYDASSLD